MSDGMQHKPGPLSGKRNLKSEQLYPDAPVETDDFVSEQNVFHTGTDEDVEINPAPAPIGAESLNVETQEPDARQKLMASLRENFPNALPEQLAAALEAATEQPSNFTSVSYENIPPPDLNKGIHTVPGSDKHGSPEGKPTFTAEGYRKDMVVIDPFYITPAVWDKLHMEGRPNSPIPADVEYCWIRNDDHADWKGKPNRFAQVEQNYGGAARVMTPNGRPYIIDDLVCVVVSKKAKEERQKFIDDEHARYYKGMRPGTAKFGGQDVDVLTQNKDAGFMQHAHWEDMSPAEKREFMDDMHNENVKSGLIGGWSEGLTLEQAMAHRTVEEMQEEQESYRQGAIHKDFTDADWNKMVGGKTTFAVGNSGIGKTTADKVAARQGARA